MPLPEIAIESLIWSAAIPSGLRILELKHIDVAAFG